MPEEERWRFLDSWPAIAAVVLLGVSVGFFVRARLEREPDPPEDSAAVPGAGGVFARGSGRGTIEGLSIGDLLDILATKKNHPAAKRFVQEFLANPRLRELWERIAKRPRSHGARALLAELQRSPDFVALLDKLKRDPQFNELLAEIRRDPKIAKLLAGAGAGGPADRMMIADKLPQILGGKTDLSGTTPVEEGPGSTVERRRRRRYGSASPEQLKGLSIILSRLRPRERSELMQRVEAGVPFVKACREAGMADSCVRVTDECIDDPACLPWLRTAAAGSQDPVFMLRTGDPKNWKKIPPANVYRAPPPPAPGEPPAPPPPGEPPPPPPPESPPPSPGPNPEPPPSSPPPSPPPSNPEPPPAPPPDPEPPPPPGEPPPGEPPPAEPPPAEPPPPPPENCMQYGSLCGQSDTDCGGNNYWWQCGECCNEGRYSDYPTNCPYNPYIGGGDYTGSGAQEHYYVCD